MPLLGWAMLGLLLVIVASGLDVLIGLRRIDSLARVPPRNDGPLVTLVTAARDEAFGIEAAARSLLALEYPALEFVMVNDRSTDRTGEILDGLAIRDSRVRVVHVRELPAGWLGKNHALHRGAAVARGEWILFADADIVMDPTTVGRAMQYVERRGVDHLTLLPRLVMPGILLEAFLSVFVVGLSAYLRPGRPATREAGISSVSGRSTWCGPAVTRRPGVTSRSGSGPTTISSWASCSSGAGPGRTWSSAGSWSRWNGITRSGS